jgi:hypothetical protein
MSPLGKRLAPKCCTANVEFGFVLVTRVTEVDTLSDGRETIALGFQARVIDAVGVAHDIDVDRCPACALLLPLLPLVELDAWQPTDAVDDAVRKVREAQAALDKMKEIP